MKTSIMFPKRFASGEDLAGKQVNLTISQVKKEMVYRKDEEREIVAYVLYFREAKKGIVLGPQLTAEIVTATGQDDTDNWPGQRVTLYATPRNVFGVTRQVFHAKRANGGEKPPASLIEDEAEAATLDNLAAPTQTSATHYPDTGGEPEDDEKPGSATTRQADDF